MDIEIPKKVKYHISFFNKKYSKSYLNFELLKINNSDLKKSE